MNRTATKSDPAFWEKIIAGLIGDATSSLPPDVRGALEKARESESETGPKAIIGTILENAEAARNGRTPMCQDTGVLTFWIDTPPEADFSAISKGVEKGVEAATKRGWLRKNVIESVSGGQISENHAVGNPVIHFRQTRSEDFKISLIMKGGGSENMSRQYSLPDNTLHAGRDLDGVRKCILDAVWQAQGNGCAPGILGVCIGGDRATGYKVAKEQFVRDLGDHAMDKSLADLEKTVLEQANSLGIGPMGLGGRTTLLGVKIGAAARLPASFFVTVAYCCWACRKKTVVIR